MGVIQSSSSVARMVDDGAGVVRTEVSRPQPVGWLALRNLAEALQLAELLHQSNCFAGVSKEQMLVRMCAGAEMGFGPLASVSGIHMVKGKPTLGAHLMASAIKRSGRYDYEVVRLDRERGEVQFYRVDGGTRRTLGPVVVVTIQEAQQAAKNNPTWQSFPDDMIFAACIRKGYRRYTPDLTGGVLAYETHELDGLPDIDPRIAGQEVLPLPAAPVPGLPEPVESLPPAVEPVAEPVAEEPDESPFPGEPAPIPPQEAADECPAPEMADERQVGRIGELIRELGFAPQQWQKAFRARGVTSARHLNRDQATDMIRSLESVRARRQAG